MEFETREEEFMVVTVAEVHRIDVQDALSFDGAKSFILDENTVVADVSHWRPLYRAAKYASM